MLIICPTPIGNISDITLRALEALAAADVIACEDTRRTGRLLKHYKIDAPLVSYHEHNERQFAARLAQRVGEGETVVLVSDAGMPLVNDPGYLLVRECIEKGLKVNALPGASSIPVALAVCGLPTDRFTFIGFLPRKQTELLKAVRSPHTLVAFESPNRLVQSLTTLAHADPQRQAVVCRELTKLNEEVARGTVTELVEYFDDERVRGEIVIVLAGELQLPVLDMEAAITALQELVAAGAKRRSAAHVVARLTGTSANQLYRSSAKV